MAASRGDSADRIGDVPRQHDARKQQSETCGRGALDRIAGCAIASLQRFADLELGVHRGEGAIEEAAPLPRQVRAC